MSWDMNKCSQAQLHPVTTHHWASTGTRLVREGEILGDGRESIVGCVGKVSQKITVFQLSN